MKYKNIYIGQRVWFNGQVHIVEKTTTAYCGTEADKDTQSMIWLNDGGTAHPTELTRFQTELAIGGPIPIVRDPIGISPREHFAGMAMQAMVSLDTTWAILAEFTDAQQSQKIAARAILLADALLLELSKNQVAP